MQCLGGAQSGRTQCRKRRHPVPWRCAVRRHPVQFHGGAQSGRTQCRKRRCAERTHPMQETEAPSALAVRRAEAPSAVPWWCAERTHPVQETGHPVPWRCAERRHPVQCLGGAQSGRTQCRKRGTLCLGGAQSGRTQCLGGAQSGGTIKNVILNGPFEPNAWHRGLPPCRSIGACARRLVPRHGWCLAKNVTLNGPFEPNAWHRGLPPCRSIDMRVPSPRPFARLVVDKNCQPEWPL